MDNCKRFKLESIPGGQCHITIHYSNNKIEKPLVVLTSYLTEVLVIDLAVPFPTVYFTNECREFLEWRKQIKSPPATTAKHINRFTTEFTGENLYHRLKEEDIIILTDEQVKNVKNRINHYIPGAV